MCMLASCLCLRTCDGIGRRLPSHDVPADGRQNRSRLLHSLMYLSHGRFILLCCSLVFPIHQLRAWLSRSCTVRWATWLLGIFSARLLAVDRVLPRRFIWFLYKSTTSTTPWVTSTTTMVMQLLANHDVRAFSSRILQCYLFHILIC
jgi:hypothetical protein